MKIKTYIFLMLLIAINLSASTLQSIEKFLNFDDANIALTSFPRHQDIYKETLVEIKSQIERWKKNEYRTKAFDLLKDDGLDISKETAFLIIERGGGGLPYQALYLSKKASFEVTGNREAVSKRKFDTTPFIANSMDDMLSIIGENNYLGDISWGGDDCQTYIITEYNGKWKTVFLYDAAIMHIKDQPSMTEDEKNTLKLYDLFWQLNKKLL